MLISPPANSIARLVRRIALAHSNRCADLAGDVGAHTAVFRPLYPAGVALDHMELMPTFEQYTGALDELASMETTGLRGLDPFGPKSRGETRPVIHTGATCGAGQHVCSVSVQGDVNPCSFLGPGFDTGNIRQTPFQVIWRTGHAMKRMRAPVGEGGFAGGCRARALRLAGSVDAPDPWLTAHEQDGHLHPSANVELSRMVALPLLEGA